jgi:DNA-binding transcriptional ArsR family regulator
VTELFAMQKNVRETIRISLDEFRGYLLLAVRVWTENKNGDAVPTKKGITLQLDSWRELLPALQKAVRITPDGSEGDTFDRVVEMANAGVERKEIAARLGVNRSTVSRHLKRADVAGLLHVATDNATATQQEGRNRHVPMEG